MRLALIANPGSGSADPEEVRRLLLGHATTVELFELGDEDAAASSGCERLVIAGGDGSIARAAAAAARHDVPLAVVPSGTANDFARALNIPDDRERACSIAANGSHLRRLDLGWCDDTPFVNVASMGLSVMALHHAEAMKAGLGSFTYSAAALVTALRSSPITVRVEVDGRLVHDGRAWQVLVGNTGAFGGGASLDAEPDDARLQVAVLERGPRVRLARHAWGLRTGELEGQPGVTCSRGREVVVQLARSRQRHVNCDGDLVRVGTRAVLRIDPRAFELVLPDGD